MYFWSTFALLSACWHSTHLSRHHGTDSTAIWQAVITATYPPQLGVRVAGSTLDLGRAPRSMSAWEIRASTADSVAVLDMLARNRTAFPIDSASRSKLERVGQPVRYVQLAHPGYSRDGRIAFVYGQFTCGPGCGWDEGFVLELREGVWVIAARKTFTVS